MKAKFQRGQTVYLKGVSSSGKPTMVRCEVIDTNEFLGAVKVASGIKVRKSQWVAESELSEPQPQ